MEPTVTKLALGPIARILDAAITGLTNVPSFLRKQAELRDFLGQVTDKYADYFSEAYGNIRILTMQKPVALQQIYTRVRLATDIQRGRQKTEQELLREILVGNKNGESLAALKVAKTVTRIVLLGRPGSGKSTFLRFFLLSELTGMEPLTQIPFLIRLSQLSSTHRSITGEIAFILERCGIHFAKELAESLLDAGRVRLLLDGLDEVRASDRVGIIDDIQHISDRYRDCSCIVTCRSSAYEFWLQDYHHYELERFSTREIVSFVRKWFDKERPLARDLAKQIVESTRLRDLCSNPLMLTIVCIGYSGTLNVSDNRSEVYRDAVDTLLRRWDSSRTIQRENPYASLTPKRREELLAEIATRTFVEGEVVFNEARARELAHSFLTTRPDAPTNLGTDDAMDVLNAIDVQHGLIEKRSPTLWAFAHLTFQEYFVASFVANRDPELRARVIESYLHRPDWREVIMLTASLLPNADEFVLAILESILRIGYGPLFGEKVRYEIAQARTAIRSNKREVSVLFDQPMPRSQPEDGKKQPRSIPARWGVIEGGVRLTLTETKEALDKFRGAVANRLRHRLFGEKWTFAEFKYHHPDC